MKIPHPGTSTSFVIFRLSPCCVFVFFVFRLSSLSNSFQSFSFFQSPVLYCMVGLYFLHSLVSAALLIPSWQRWQVTPEWQGMLTLCTTPDSRLALHLAAFSFHVLCLCLLNYLFVIMLYCVQSICRVCAVGNGIGMIRFLKVKSNICVTLYLKILKLSLDLTLRASQGAPPERKSLITFERL